MDWDNLQRKMFPGASDMDSGVCRELTAGWSELFKGDF